MGSNPVEAWSFFRLSNFNCLMGGWGGGRGEGAAGIDWCISETVYNEQDLSSVSSKGPMGRSSVYYTLYNSCGSIGSFWCVETKGKISSHDCDHSTTCCILNTYGWVYSAWYHKYYHRPRPLVGSYCGNITARLL